jgi:hypothetical protein
VDIGRCCELGTPELALRILGDRPRHGLSLPSLAAGRRLLFALSAPPRASHETETGASVPLQDVVTTAALFNVSSLPPINADVYACAFVLRACYRATDETKTHKEAEAIARALLPSLQALLAATPAAEMRVPRHAGERQWLRVALRDVRRALAARGADVKWLDAWMAEAGYVRRPAAGTAGAGVAGMSADATGAAPTELVV